MTRGRRDNRYTRIDVFQIGTKWNTPIIKMEPSYYQKIELIK